MACSSFFVLALALLSSSSSLALPLSAENASYSIIGSLLPDHLQVNLQELSNLAMNSVRLSNHSLTELYRQSAEIINGTEGADSVLLELDPVDGNSSEPRILVMAVYNPDAPSHDDLLDQFSLYFVNMTDSMPNATTTSLTTASNPEVALQPPRNQSAWSVLTNFFRNQANAMVGAMWIPFNVGAQAIQQITNDHAKYVAAGTTFGSALSRPIIMQSIALPNNVASRIVNVTSSQVAIVESAEAASKQAITGAVNSAADGVEASGRLAVKYVARPVGAFVGANVNVAGQAVTLLGQGLDSVGIQLNLLGEQLGAKAQSVVSGGSWALAWGMDNDVKLPSELAAANRTQLRN